MRAAGVVRAWHEDEGWGVISSAVTPGGCWAHFSSVRVDGLATLRTGQAVTFEFEAVDQDGFRFRAVEAWPTGGEPVPQTIEVTGSAAFQSTLTLTFDDPGTSDPG